MTHLTQAQQALALRALADALDQGHPAEALRVGSDGVTVLANPVSAERWKARFGDELAGFPLSVSAVDVLDVTA